MDKLDKTYDEIRDRIFSLLDEKGISQKEFAQILGISSQTITDWKKGKSRSFSNKFPIIAQKLGTTTEWLLEGTGPRFITEEERELRCQQIVDKFQRAARHREATDIQNSLSRTISNRGLTIDDFTLNSDDPVMDYLLRSAIAHPIPASKAEIQAAFWGGEKDLTDEDKDAMWADVERFAQFLAEKRRQEKKNG